MSAALARAVAEGAWRPPEREERLGLGFYATDTPGVVGALKASAEAFRVTEISSHPLPDPEGSYVVLTLASRDWEQHELAEAVARRLHLAPGSVHWSGTKDRRAVSQRLFSYRGPPPETDFGLRDVELRGWYRARDGLVLGHHYGNAFDIVVSELARGTEAALESFRRTERSLREGPGFPNFFGPQRFGEVRPVTHEVGRWIVRGDLARAVDVYLAERPVEGEPGPGDAARVAFAEHHDPARALREFPATYRFEHRLLEHLARGHSPERALRALSRDLRTLFVHAYQSWIFNRWLSDRRAGGLPLDGPVEGDRIVRIGRDGTIRGNDSVPVEADNRAECAELVRRGGARVGGPIVGFDSPPSVGEAGRLLERILAEEGIERAQFAVRAAPELASRGTYRPIVVPAPPMGLAGEEGAVRFRFALPKGAYATVLLREYLKDGARRTSSAAGAG